MAAFDLAGFLGDLDLSAFQGEFRDSDELTALRGSLSTEFSPPFQSPSSPQLGNLESRRLGRLGAVDRFTGTDNGFGNQSFANFGQQQAGGPASTNFLANQQNPFLSFLRPTALGGVLTGGSR